jgi:hypothetical protein
MKIKGLKKLVKFKKLNSIKMNYDLYIACLFLMILVTIVSIKIWQKKTNSIKWNDKIYKIGLFLMIPGFLVSIITWYFEYYSLPVFFTGIGIVLFSKQTVKVKVITICIPFMIYFTFNILFYLWVDLFS